MRKRTKGDDSKNFKRSSLASEAVSIVPLVVRHNQRPCSVFGWLYSDVLSNIKPILSECHPVRILDHLAFNV